VVVERHDRRGEQVRRVTREDGFSLPELLVAITVALVISLACFTLIEVTMRRSGEVAGRVEASQKGRAAMDFMTRQLRSQVCLGTNIPPMVAGTANEVRFYTDLNRPELNLPPELHRITYDPTARTLVERAFVGTGAAPNVVYPATATRTKLLAERVVPYRPTGATADLPIFSYYAYNLATPPRPALALGVPLSATDLGRVARIEINFRKLTPGRTLSTRGSIVLQDEVYVRAADPNDPAPTPTCA
jgi:prepilin-type N-terminal cleavage/methylation domain-containing protein